MLQKKNRYNLCQAYGVLIRQDPPTHNHFNCLLKILQLDLCLIPEIFPFFHVFMSDFESFGLTRAKSQAPFPPRRNRVNHVNSSQSGIAKDIIQFMLVYFQHTPKNYIQYIFPGSLLAVACDQFNFMLPDTPLFKSP